MTLSLWIQIAQSLLNQRQQQNWKDWNKMNTHELCTSLEKHETQPEIVLRKAETNLRFSAQPETKIAFANDLRKFSVKNKNSLKFPTHTKICGRRSYTGILPAGSSPVRLEPSSLAMQTI